MNKRKKVLAIIIVSVIAISVFFTGTFAWQSISQLALNEVAGNPNPGGRLHDDFNGRDKKVYVENFYEWNFIRKTLWHSEDLWARTDSTEGNLRKRKSGQYVYCTGSWSPTKIGRENYSI